MGYIQMEAAVEVVEGEEKLVVVEEEEEEEVVEEEVEGVALLNDQLGELEEVAVVLVLLVCQEE